MWQREGCPKPPALKPALLRGQPLVNSLRILTLGWETCTANTWLIFVNFIKARAKASRSHRLSLLETNRAPWEIPATGLSFALATLPEGGQIKQTWGLSPVLRIVGTEGKKSHGPMRNRHIEQ